MMNRKFPMKMCLTILITVLAIDSAARWLGIAALSGDSLLGIMAAAGVLLLLSSLVVAHGTEYPR